MERKIVEYKNYLQGKVKFYEMLLETEKNLNPPTKRSLKSKVEAFCFALEEFDRIFLSEVTNND